MPLAAVVLAVSLAAGCADDVAPAATAGDGIEITHDALMDEVAQWAGSAALLEQVGSPPVEGDAPGSYSSSLVGVVLTNRIRFDLHRQQFTALGLTPDPAEESSLREQLAPVLEQVGEGFGNRLVDDLVRVNAVSVAMADEYEAWFLDSTDGVEVSPRYGEWDDASGAVLPPDGPRQPPGDLLEP